MKGHHFHWEWVRGLLQFSLWYSNNMPMWVKFLHQVKSRSVTEICSEKLEACQLLFRVHFLLKSRFRILTLKKMYIYLKTSHELFSLKLLWLTANTDRTSVSVSTALASGQDLDTHWSMLPRQTRAPGLLVMYWACVCVCVWHGMG